MKRRRNVEIPSTSSVVDSSDPVGSGSLRSVVRKTVIRSVIIFRVNT